MFYIIRMKFYENITGKKACYKTTFHYVKGFRFLHFYYHAHQTTFNSYSDTYNANLYQGDVCELFIRYGKKNHYYEIEVAPNGAVFLADIENINDVFKGTLIEKCFIKTKVKRYKNSYKVTIKIPKEYIKTKKLQFNAFRIDTDGEKPDKHLFALHPTMCGSFHKEKFIK